MPLLTQFNAFITLMRPHQYSKNLFIFAPAFFGFGQYELGAVALDLCIAFCGFCLVASGIYAINDCLDAKLDALHPSKAARPIASGLISPALGYAFGIALLLIGGGGIYDCGQRFRGKLAASSLRATAYLYHHQSRLLPIS
ncbi:UbiA family prenyltransferase [Helicobacter zhangjianzhongii]|uniref:UbiA family prenyltransferase n=1 Tax=Helicobacter zhangjianzhongii TaxID=2974574 RepID=UPI002556DD7B|nr:UbiA family prenyltransferase [Helicobacter sp. CPD2-1]MDL0079866.1 UbiA family prenyltransferase [Helicobacter sp. CPD2-1]